MKRNSGFGLIEVLIAVTVTVIILVALAMVVTNANRVSYYASRQDEASALAREQIEYVRSARDEVGWEDFLSSLPNTCDGFSSEPGKIVSCSLAVSKVDNEEVEVAVTVTFQDGDAVRTVTEETILTKWE